MRYLILAAVLMCVGACAARAKSKNAPAVAKATPWADGATDAAAATPLDSAALTGAASRFIAALERGDEAAVADGVLLPLVLSRDESQLYARRLILGSQLQWELKRKFGVRTARTAMVRGGLEGIPRVDATALRWERVRIRPASGAAGGIEAVIGKPLDARGGSFFLTRTARGWKVDRTFDIPALLIVNLEDAPVRNAEVGRVLEDVKSGKLNSAELVADALVLHAPTTRPATGRADRSTPEGAIAAMYEAIERGDVATVADSYQYMRTDDPVVRRQWAERAVADRKLAKALNAKFGPEQGARLVKECGLEASWTNRYAKVGWVVGGDVARAVLEQQRYDVAMRMVRRGGVWRIEIPPTDVGWHREKTADEKARDRWNADRPRRENELLAHLDQYHTPGSVLDALNAAPGMLPESSPEGQARQIDQRVKEARKQLAAQPAATPQEAFDQQMGMLVLELSAALVHQDARAAAKFFVADGDDGAYVVARETRALAISRLSDAAHKEIGTTAGSVAAGLLDMADDLYGLAMMEWKVQGNEAVVTKPEDDNESRAPKLRKVGKVWRIDVTAETAGNAKQAAARAMEETGKIEQLTEDVKKLKFKTLEQFRAAMIAAGIKGANRPM